MQKACLLFDFDGVIVDSFEICYAALEAHYPNATREGYRRKFLGNIYEDAQVIEQGDEAHVDLSKNDRHRSFFAMYEEGLSGLHPVKGFSALLNECARSFDMAVLTSSLNPLVGGFLNKHGLNPPLSRVLGADVHKSKAHKIGMILSELQLPPERCLFITDTLGDIREAAVQGVPSVGVSWGFHNEATLLEGAPVEVAHDIDGLRGAIKQYFHSLEI